MTLSTTDTPVLDLLASMTADSIEASSLDPETLILVRIAALAAVDAPAVSYLLNLGAASDIGVSPDQVRGVLAAVAPIVGTARIASATRKDREGPQRCHRDRRDRGRGRGGRQPVANADGRLTNGLEAPCRLRGFPRRRPASCPSHSSHRLTDSARGRSPDGGIAPFG